MKRYEGITLIALIITVIVMLILAGVVMSLIAGEGNIIANAQDTANKYNTGAQEEKNALEKLLYAVLAKNSEYTFIEGTNQELKDLFTINGEKEGEIPECTINSKVVTNVNELEVGTYKVICSYKGKTAELILNIILKTTVFEYTGKSQGFIVKYTGTYKIECWGAQGGSYGRTGGKGAYTEGTIKLKEGQKLYVYVGQCGDNTTAVTYNGGGAAGGYYNARSGGGATDVRLYASEDYLWSNFESLKSRIMVAAGGGGSDYYASRGSNGGAAGAFTGDNGGAASVQWKHTKYTVAGGATQTRPGTPGRRS